MGCSHDCGSCGSSDNCAEKSLLKQPHAGSNIKKIIGVISGKGGVGKSSVTSLLAVALNRAGYKVGIMDADITGPSIPRAFGMTQQADGDENGIIPVKTETGITVMSMNLLLGNETDPVIWRGPVIGGAVGQFYTDVIWGDIDYMLVDMPPGTGDVALTVFQQLPIDGIVIVTTPQDLVAMIVEKAVKMADLMNIPVLGMVENMSYYKCPDCGKEHAIFGISNIDSIAEGYGITAVSRLPINPKVAAACDRGMIETADTTGLENVISAVLGAANKIEPEYEDGVGKIAVPYENGEVCKHFGHAPEFKIYKVADLQLAGEYVVKNENQGHKGTVDMLWKEGVEVILCGNIGEAAEDLLAESGILYFKGVSGSADEAIASFLNGTLECEVPDMAGCGDCGDHSDGCGGCCGGCH